MRILATNPVKTTIAKQIKYQMERYERLRKLREHMKTVKDEEKHLGLFEDFQRAEYTHRLIIQKENSRPPRQVKTKEQLLKCVSFQNREFLVEEITYPEVAGEDSNEKDLMAKLRMMCIKNKHR